MAIERPHCAWQKSFECSWCLPMFPSQSRSNPHQIQYIKKRGACLAEIGSDSHFSVIVRCRPKARKQEYSQPVGAVTPRQGPERKATNSAVIHRKRCSALEGDSKSIPLPRPPPLSPGGKDPPMKGVPPSQTPCQGLPPIDRPLRVVPPLKTPASVPTVRPVAQRAKRLF